MITYFLGDKLNNAIDKTEYNKLYRQYKKEEINNYYKQRDECPKCNSIMSKQSKSKHMKYSKKCPRIVKGKMNQIYMNLLNEIDISKIKEEEFNNFKNRIEYIIYTNLEKNNYDVERASIFDINEINKIINEYI
jgi:hypothetical protein